MRQTALLLGVLLISISAPCSSFQIPAHQPRTVRWRRGSFFFLTPAATKVSTPSPDEAAAIGIREWPQQTKSGTWQERGRNLIRYVLDGEGFLSYDDKRTKVGPGTLVEVDNEDEEESELIWECTTPSMIILTPGYEEGGKLLAVGLALAVLSIALVAGVGL